MRSNLEAGGKYLVYPQLGCAFLVCLKIYIYFACVSDFSAPEVGMCIDSLNRNPVKDSVIYKVPRFSLINSNMKKTV